ncbi:LysR family transcriptional regulator [Limnohabitans sp.]|uniref:LysR family transcriptional regulator n=1 Tax=Limnohabitans sp. TaxID=1907725 RepID=UPI0039BC6AAE|nr:LysR family transcriptional regulator [Comamonadaceae bacterium]
MNLRHLEHWLALADTGSFSRAAEKLHITQSALSRSIQALEEDLGGPLVDRVGKKNELTPLGRSVLERARRIVHEAQELKQGAALLKQGGLGALRVGLGSGPGAMLMTPWLVYMAQHHPTVQVTVSRGSTELQLTQLRERQLDALVVDVRRVEAAPDLKMTQVVEMRACFVCRQGHPLMERAAKGLPFDALLSYPIASIELSQEVARLLVDHYGPQANPAQMTTLQCEDIASLLEVVGQTDAIYLGIVGAAREGLAQGRLVELPMQIPLKGQARLALITLAGRTELPVMSVFRAFVQNHLSD